MTEAPATKILFVDDEPDLEVLMRQRFRRQLKANDYDFYFAQNGIEALKILEEHNDIWLVISDINMPEMDGLTLLDEINKNHPRVIAIIVSAYGDMSNIRQAMNLGAFDFVTKPINFEDFNKTVDKTLKHIQHLLDSRETSEKLEGILTELDVARNIQQSILPRQFIENDTLQIYADMRAAKQIGGDFYDFFFLDEAQTKLALVIADVSGKGIPAALFMTVSRTLMRAKTPEFIHSPAKAITAVNQILAEDNPNMMFVTVFYAILDMTNGEMIYTNAGHNPPYILSADKNTFLLDQKHGPALGVTDFEYQEFTHTLKPQDTLVLYTDGVTEAENVKSECYGDDKLKELLAEHHNLAPKQLIHKIEEELNAFAAGHIQSDDITTLVCKYLGGKQT